MAEEKYLSTEKRVAELLEMAREEFVELSEAEFKLFDCAARGALADCSSGDEEKDDPANKDQWGAERTIRARCIEWLCTDNDAKALVSHKGIQAWGAKVEGKLSLDFIIIPFSIFLEKCAVKNGISLIYAQIRALNLPGTHTGPITADSLKVEGDVFMRNGFHAEGEVRLPRAKIGGDFDCENGSFINSSGNAISADGMKVKGYVLFRNGFRAEGEVRLLGAEIDADIECGEGSFVNTKGIALNANSVKIKGNLLLSDGFNAEGQLIFIKAIIDGGFQYQGIDSPEKAELDLRSAKIGTLYDEQKSWPDKGKLHLSGLVYDEIYDKAPTDAKSRIEWLNLQDDDKYRPQPYEQLAKVLKAAGREEQAKKILIEKNKARIRLGNLNRIDKLWLKFLGWTVGYGYRPWNALIYCLVFYLLGVVYFHQGWKTGVMSPVKPNAYVRVDGRETMEIRQDYPCMSAWAYSADVFIPLVNLHQKEFWLPNARLTNARLLSERWVMRVSGERLCWWLWVETLSGWVLTTLLIVGVSGLIRK